MNEYWVLMIGGAHTKSKIFQHFSNPRAWNGPCQAPVYPTLTAVVFSIPDMGRVSWHGRPCQTFSKVQIPHVFSAPDTGRVSWHRRPCQDVVMLNFHTFSMILTRVVSADTGCYVRMLVAHQRFSFLLFSHMVLPSCTTSVLSWVPSSFQGTAQT